MPALGNSGLDVFPLALGGNTFGWTSDEAASFAILDAYAAAGGNFVDTADSYTSFVPGNSGGESETILGAWMSARHNRDQIVLATKVAHHPEFMGLSASNVAAADASLGRLGTDYIDVYYAHFDDPETPLAETVGAFDALLRAGKVRAVALSNYSADRIQEWFTIARREGYALPTVLQPNYNLVFRAAYERDIAPVAAAENLAVVPYFALASGFLTGKYRTKADLEGSIRAKLAGRYFSDAGLAVVDALDKIATARGVAISTVALAWLRGRPNVVAPIASARTLEQLPALVAPLDLAPEERTTLDEVSARIEG